MVKQYLVSEEELDKILFKGALFEDIFKSKKPVVVIAEGEIVMAHRGSGKLGILNMTFDNLETINVDAWNITGKKGKLIFIEDKE